jgi:hypothetical protein
MPVSKCINLAGFMYLSDTPVTIQRADDDDTAPEGTAAFLDSYNTRGSGVRVYFASEPTALIDCPVGHISSDIGVIFRALPMVNMKGFKPVAHDMDDECFCMWSKGKYTIVLCYSND